MALRTVRVPASMRELFERAEEVVSAYFARQRAVPSEGRIEIFDERYVLMRGASLSVEFFDLVRDLLGPSRTDEADEFARNILFDLAHAMGKADARAFHAKMGLSDPVARLSAGPVHFAFAGWAFVDIHEDARAVPSEEYVLTYDHPYSFEADAWLRAGRRSAWPVCVMGAGYSSGWCEESFGVELVAAEVACRACGDDHCRFVMAPPSRIEARIAERVGSSLPTPPQGRRYHIPDFFARKRLEDELRRARDELEERVRERTAALERANRELTRQMEERAAIERRLAEAERLEALGRLSAGIAHDFNNLLTVINTNAEMLAGQVTDPSQAADLAREILEAGRRAKGLTEQLLVFGRHDVDSTGPVDLSAAVARMEAMLRRLLTNRIRLSTRLSDTPATIDASAVQIEQTILNLVVNARDAIEGTGHVEVSVEVAGDRVQLAVADDGCGMDDDVRARIFDPFFTTKEAGRGSGLGMAIVYGVVQRSQGTISVESAVGEGTRVVIDFPRSTTTATENIPASAATEQAPATSRTILLLDDDDAVRTTLGRWLRRRGHVVHEAATLDDARAIYDAHGDAIDVLLSDVVLRGESGAPFARTVHAERSDVRVVLITGYAGDHEGVKAARDEGICALQKPLDLVRLAGLVEGEDGGP